MHCDGRNVDLTALPENVRVINGKGRFSEETAGGLDASFDGLVLLGLHARAGTPNACLAHTYEHETLEIRINGSVVGEIGVEAALAGEFGVPVVLMIGDSAGAAEAEALLPGVRTAVVKESLTFTSASLLSPAATRKLITAAARAAATETETETKTKTPIAPHVPASPVTLEIDLADGAFADKLRAGFPEAFPTTHTLTLEGPSLRGIWARYTHMRDTVNDVPRKISDLLRPR